MPRNRTLKEINHVLTKDSSIIESTLSDLIAGTKNKPVKFLKVGFGHGRALMELAYGFRNQSVEFFGLNKSPEKKVPLTKSEDLIDIAVHYGVAARDDLKNFRLPTIYFYDAKNLHFDNESLDFICCVGTARHIQQKARFLEEVCRALCPGGIALVHLGDPPWNYPYGPASQDKQLTPYCNRFILKYGQELIPLPDYLKLFEGNGLRFQFLESEKCILKITKGNPARLDLQLKYNADYSVSMREFFFQNTKKPSKGGFRTVYDISPEKYQALIEQGLLVKFENVSH